MTRPWIIWLLSLCCAAGIFGAMGVITHRSLRVEQEGAQARADAELQERLRLALWRMETDASTLLVEENNRPPDQFHPTPQKASPLVGELPKHVRLHFDIEPGGKVNSPQSPETGPVLVEGAQDRLRQLRALLARSPSLVWSSRVVQPVANGGSVSGTANGLMANAVFLEAAANNTDAFGVSPVPASNGMGNDVTLKGEAEPKGQRQAVIVAEAMKQQGYNAVELNRRAQVYTKIGQGTLELKGSPSTSSMPPKAEKKAPSKGKQEGAGDASQSGRPNPGKPSPAAAQPREALGKDQTGAGTGMVEAPAPQQDTGKLAAAPAPVEPPPQPMATAFRPFWLENELFLVREVMESGRRRVQGVWLDADSLKASLLATIADILPRAGLQPVARVAFVSLATGALQSERAAGGTDPMDLIGLPWRLVPGETPLAIVTGWTSMRLTLAAAWLGALLAALAAAGLLFGVTRLSERRASFVSSVTHELRTPLTTFRLYSELLEQGMVKEEADRAQYLHTLRTEADRLTHLVDNVLAYSRIERTNRRSRMERLDLASWIERVRPRLEDRAGEAGMKLELSLPLHRNDLACVTDATALEQIVFNLVDNACKYAAGRCADSLVQVSLERRGRWMELRVCDTGPGIPPRERGRLFRPFHKSADEAANSKPGVGLGLALCHRLASALGGRLVLEKHSGQQPGACFALRLPAA